MLTVGDVVHGFAGLWKLKVNEQDMEDTYLPAFQAGVEKGNA
eukprot:SAG31_NODE_15401_length_757_cov_0.810030_2_plen_42_part_00